MPLQPVLKSGPGFCCIGVERYTTNGIASIQEADDEFERRREEIPNQLTPKRIYGFNDYSRSMVMRAGEFPLYHYIAAMEVRDLSRVPSGMVGKQMPAAKYAIFSYRGAMVGLARFFREIYDDWFPGSGFQLDPDILADYLYYPKPIIDFENALVEIHVPVVPK